MTEARTIDWKNGDWYCHGVLDGTLTVERIYENEQALAFYSPPEHEHKRYKTHIYVIPKRHITTLLDLGPEDGPLLASLLEAIQVVARKLELDEAGFFIRANVMPPFQHTGHIHIHLYSGERG